jgi:hypothetical protein
MRTLQLEKVNKHHLNLSPLFDNVQPFFQTTKDTRALTPSIRTNTFPQIANSRDPPSIVEHLSVEDANV